MPLNEVVEHLNEDGEYLHKVRKHFNVVRFTLPEGIFTMNATHPQYSRYTPMILLRHLLTHDHLHMYRNEGTRLTKEEYPK